MVFKKKYWLYRLVQTILLVQSGHLWAFSPIPESFKEWFQHVGQNRQQSVTLPSFSYSQDAEKGVDVAINTTDFTLRTFKNKDVPFLRSLYQDPVLMKTLMTNGQPCSNEQFSNLLKYWQIAQKNSPFTLYVLEDKRQKRPIGAFELLPKDDTLEVSYVISQAFQGQGWGTKLMHTVMNTLIPQLKQKSVLQGKNSLIGYALRDNLASIHLLNHSGFVPKIVEGNAGFSQDWKLFEFPLQPLSTH